MAYEIHENVPVNAVVGMEGEYPLSAMNVGDMFEINLAQEFHLDEFQDSDLAQMERPCHKLASENPSDRK